MLRYPAIVLFIHLFFFGYPQKVNETEVIAIRNKIASLHKSILEEMPTQPNFAYQSIKQARELISAIHDPVLELQISVDLGTFYKFNGQLDSAIYVGYRNLIKAGKISNDSLKALIYSELGIVYSKKGISDSAVYYHLKNLHVAEKSGNRKETIRALYFLGAVFNKIGNFDKAREYFLECNREALNYKDDFLIAYSYDGLASHDYSVGNYQQALVNYQQAVAIYKRLNKKNNEATCYQNLSSLYDELDNSELSINYSKQALKLFENLNAKNEMLACYLNLGATYTNYGNFPLALENYSKAEILGTQLNSIDNLQTVYENLALTYKLMGNSEKALEYYQKFTSLKDSVLNINKLNYINELEKKYETEKRENAITLLTKENQIKEAENKLQKRRSVLLLITSALLLIISTLVFFIFRQKARNARDLAEKNEQLYRKRINEIIKEQELKSINEIMEGQENERKRIAEDLHDRLGSMLATIKMHFNAVEQKIETIELKSIDQYHRANKLLDEVCDEVRKIAHNMESGVLANFGLVHALEELKQALEHSSNMTIAVSSFGMKERFSHLVEISVYRVIQELISNVIKHAKATEVTIDLNKTQDTLTVMVTDNGVGFDFEAARNKEGMGLKNIQSRIYKLNGRFYVDSGKKNGTTSIIEIPLNND